MERFLRFQEEKIGQIALHTALSCELVARKSNGEMVQMAVKNIFIFLRCCALSMRISRVSRHYWNMYRM